jgi:amidohydrolase
MDKTSDIISIINKAVEKHSAKCLELSNYLSAHPEISGEEKESCAYITNFLKDYGYEIVSPLVNVPYSFLAIDKTTPQSGKPRVAIMCEYDALPEVGHACGHSVSCAISILAALTLREAFKDFPMQVDLIGTPSEEFGGGKILLADNGAFDGYSYAAMAHLYSDNVPYFKVLASCDMQVTFHGKSAHASSEPWEGKNALNGVQLFFHALDMMRQHLTPDCQMHGIINNGGILPSIVPEEACCYLYPRAGSIQNLNKLWDKMVRCAEGAAMATETTCDIKMLYNKYGDLYTTPTAKVLLNDLFTELEIPFSGMETALGSTDAGNVDVFIPTFHPGVAIGTDPEIKLHSKEFADLVKSEAALPALITGARILAGLCAQLAYIPGLLDKIQKEHREHRKDS